MRGLRRSSLASGVAGIWSMKAKPYSRMKRMRPLMPGPVFTSTCLTVGGLFAISALHVFTGAKPARFSRV
ncbi:hypothetical protein KC335_g174 [Hortaea werneckii]|nr:hypothetical protein KC335_g174 [Hortaea werneckii]